jgi:hypothetical protein
MRPATDGWYVTRRITSRVDVNVAAHNADIGGTGSLHLLNPVLVGVSTLRNGADML